MPSGTNVTLETYGLEPDPDWLRTVATVIHTLRTAKKRLRTAMKQPLDTLGQLPFPNGGLKYMQNRYIELAEALEAFQPVALCPYCKGNKDRQSLCVECQTKGWATAAEYAAAPAVLKVRVR